jgi:hypothetical protein
LIELPPTQCFFDPRVMNWRVKDRVGRQALLQGYVDDYMTEMRDDDVVSLHAPVVTIVATTDFTSLVYRRNACSERRSTFCLHPYLNLNRSSRRLRQQIQRRVKSLRSKRSSLSLHHHRLNPTMTWWKKLPRCRSKSQWHVPY